MKVNARAELVGLFVLRAMKLAPAHGMFLLTWAIQTVLLREPGMHAQLATILNHSDPNIAMQPSTTGDPAP